ncbi:MAG: hypothetical protein IKE28_10365 [Solobacterium sp.]|nr:hypothetical protein [Solobacterium sp.]
MKQKKPFARSLCSAALSVALLLTGMELVITNVYAEGPGDPPSGEPNGTPPDGAPEGTPPDGKPGEKPEGGMPGGGQPGGGGDAVTEWTAVTTYDSDTETTGETYDSTGTDENAILVSGGTVTLNTPEIKRTSAESQGGDSSSFYGVGAAVLTTDGTTVINDGTITTDANGAAGAFSYSNGVTYISDTVIRTSGNTAGGIHAAGGGTVYAWNLDVETQGESSAAIRSDRGGGTMVVDGGTYVTNGNGSPAVYVTADITVNDAVLTANGSEGICIEGKNTLRLFDTDLTSNMSDLEQNDHTWSVILYQSMSGDSEEGNSAFYMIGGSLTSNNGGLFYTTNTQSEFYLENVEITASEDSEYFLMVTGNTNQRGWGTAGANGADTDFTAVNQKMNGNIIWDSISNLDFYMQKGSVLTGAILNDETYAGSGGNGYASVSIDSESSWIVTGNSVVTNLYNEGKIADAEGKTVSIVGTDGTVYVEGDSEYTVTVTTYSDTADFFGATASVSYEDYRVNRPEGTVSEKTAAETEPAQETAAETAETSNTLSPVAIIAGGIAVVLLAVLLIKTLRK